MNKRKKIILISLLSIIFIMVLVIGTTKSFMKPIEQGGNITEVSLSSCAKIKLNGNNSINLTNSYPMSRNRGLQTTPYTFTVSSYCDSYIGFNLYIAILDGNTLDASAIHFIITNKDSKVALKEGVLSDLDEETNFSDAAKTEFKTGLKSNYIKIYKMISNKVPLKGERSYDLYLFVDEKVEVDTSGKTFKAGIAINSYDRESGANANDYCANDENLNTCIPTLADLFKSEETNIYHHDGTLENGIDDNSYRYSGAGDKVNNLVCFGSYEEICPYNNLYRIIGVIDNKVKLIKYDYATKEELGSDGAYAEAITPESYYKGKLTTIDVYYWNSVTNTNTWSESNLNKVNLNTNFINSLNEEWVNKIADTNWKVGGNTFENIIDVSRSVAYQNEIVNPASPDTYEAKIGLMYISDYGFATTPNHWSEKYNTFNGKYVDWFYIGESDHTITKKYNNNEYFIIYGGGSIGGQDPHLRTDGVRPVFFLNDDVKYNSGTGTQLDPIRLS